MKVARGRSWQPEIGMEHASRGRRSGNKGVGARWRGRFRIFSARHCSRTKVSHAENSGMTMLFFLWRLLRCRRGILSQARERPATHAAAGAAARGVRGDWGIVSHALERWHERVRGGGFNPLRGATTGVVMRRRATSGEMARGGLVFVFSLEVAPVSEGDSFTRYGVDGTPPCGGAGEG